MIMAVVEMAAVEMTMEMIVLYQSCSSSSLELHNHLSSSCVFDWWSPCNYGTDPALPNQTQSKKTMDEKYQVEENYVALSSLYCVMINEGWVLCFDGNVVMARSSFQVEHSLRCPYLCTTMKDPQKIRVNPPRREYQRLPTPWDPNISTSLFKASLIE